MVVEWDRPRILWHTHAVRAQNRQKQQLSLNPRPSLQPADTHCPRHFDETHSAAARHASGLSKYLCSALAAEQVSTRNDGCGFIAHGADWAYHHQAVALACHRRSDMVSRRLYLCDETLSRPVQSDNCWIIAKTIKITWRLVHNLVTRDKRSHDAVLPI